LPENKAGNRLPGTDGKAKMSKSLGNCIYLSDSADEVAKKVMSMFTDPNHLAVNDPGEVENNPVFIYLDAFCEDRDTFEEMCAHYRRGGLGDVKVKRYLSEVLEAKLGPIRARREEYEKNVEFVHEMLRKGAQRANETANATLKRAKEAIGIQF
jgi:tryptophanyl-tRNA synthetase